MEKGKKISFDLYGYELTASWETPYGICYLYKFKDFLQNVFIWKTFKLIDDDIRKVTAIVKDNITYNGVNEIVLKYCKFS